GSAAMAEVADRTAVPADTGTCTGLTGVASQENGWTAPVVVSSTRRALNDIRLARGGAGHDQAFFFELARYRHDFLLRFFDFTKPDGAEHVHLLFQQIGGAFRHVREEAAANVLARALECHGEDLLVGSLDDLAERVVFEVTQIVKDEHQVAN